jgi:hypothetical protein
MASISRLPPTHPVSLNLNPLPRRRTVCPRNPQPPAAFCAIGKPSSETTSLTGVLGRGEKAMAIQTPRELATNLRENAVDCENLAKDLPPEHRTRLLVMAEHYRRLADKIDESRCDRGRWRKP